MFKTKYYQVRGTNVLSFIPIYYILSLELKYQMCHLKSTRNQKHLFLSKLLWIIEMVPLLAGISMFLYWKIRKMFQKAIILQGRGEIILGTNSLMLIRITVHVNLTPLTDLMKVQYSDFSLTFERPRALFCVCNKCVTLSAHMATLMSWQVISA